MQIEKLLEETAELSLEDQEILLEIIKKRLSEEKRNAIYKNFVEAKEDFRSDNVERGGVDELFNGIK